MRGRRSLWASPGRPIEIELTKITLLPARANWRIRWAFECGWWYHQSSPPKQIIERFRSTGVSTENTTTIGPIRPIGPIIPTDDGLPLPHRRIDSFHRDGGHLSIVP